MEKVLVLLTFLGSVIALVFALVTAKKVLKFEEGTPLMQKISASIREGANAYLKRQYTIVAIFFACMFVVLCIMAATGLLTWFVPFAFVTGGFFSGLSGFIGMRIATKANCRQCLPQQPEPRPARSVLRRFRYGLYRSRPGSFGYFHLVHPAEVRL